MLLPEEFSNFHQLATIDLAENEFEVIPDILRRLPMLTTINLNSNKIKDVGREDYDSMQCLEKLSLKDNPLREEVRTLLLSVVRINILI